MKRVLFIIMIAFFPVLLSCSNYLNDLMDGSKSALYKTDPDPSQYSYLAYMYSSERGPALNDTVIAGFADDEYSDEIQKALNITLSFPFYSPFFEGDDADPVDDWLSHSWWNSLPGDISLFMGDLGGEPDAQTMALLLAEYLNTPEGSTRVNEFLIGIKEKITSLIEFGQAVEADSLDEDITDEIAESGIIQDQTILKSFAAMSHSMTMMQIAAMIQNQIYMRDLSEQLEVVTDTLVEICSLREDLESSMQIIEQKIEQQYDGIEDTQFLSALGKVETAQNMLKGIHSQIQALTFTSYIQKNLENLLLYQNTYVDAFNSAFDGAETMQDYIRGNDLSDSFDTKIHMERETDYFNDPEWSITCAIAKSNCAWSCYQGSCDPPACNLTLWCETRTNLELINYTFNKPGYFLNMSLQHIALMRRLSLERLSLLAYIVKGDDLLALRKSFAEQDLEKLQKIKSTMTWIDEQIDAFIAAMEFDPEEAPFWILYYSTSTVIADEEDGYSDEEMNSLLRGAMREYVDNNTYIRDYIIAAKALVLNWEIQLKAHIAAGE